MGSPLAARIVSQVITVVIVIEKNYYNYPITDLWFYSINNPKNERTHASGNGNRIWMLSQCWSWILLK